MKSEFRQNGMWWSWVETCDRCGATICGHETKTTQNPNLEEVDFCGPCLRYLMDNKIPYETAKKTYKK